MRFIRKGGRVIPIRDPSDYDRGARKASAVAGLGMATLAAGGRELAIQALKARGAHAAGDTAAKLSAISKMNRSAAVAWAGYTALVGGAITNAVLRGKADRARKEQTGSRATIGQNLKEGLRNARSMVGGAALGLGTYAGAIALGKRARPYAKAARETFKFWTAKQVPNFKPVKGFLK